MKPTRVAQIGALPQAPPAAHHLNARPRPPAVLGRAQLNKGMKSMRGKIAAQIQREGSKKTVKHIGRKKGRKEGRN